MRRVGRPRISSLASEHPLQASGRPNDPARCDRHHAQAGDETQVFGHLNPSVNPDHDTRMIVDAFLREDPRLRQQEFASSRYG